MCQKCTEKFGFTWSEEYRHQCEVRELIRERLLRGVAWLRNFLEQKSVAKRRAKLEYDIREQWTKGNRGEKGVGYEKESKS